MTIDIFLGVLLPLMGTTLGAACVFFLRGEMNKRIQSALMGLAAGIMVAASVWSLLLPALERAEGWGRLSFLPAAIGILLGMLFLPLVDSVLSKVFPRGREEGSSLLMLAVTLHNLPEGMAVGAVLAGLLAGEQGITAASALALSMGIAIQNFPEGAIISMPRYGRGLSRGRAFADGFLSGVIEPVGALVTLLAAYVIVPLLPFLLGFAAGAMLYAVTDELIPEVSAGGYARVGNLTFAVGFVFMMALDVAFG